MNKYKAKALAEYELSLAESLKEKLGDFSLLAKALGQLKGLPETDWQKKSISQYTCLLKACEQDIRYYSDILHLNYKALIKGVYSVLDM